MNGREQMQQHAVRGSQSYSITSSARASSVGGTSRPIARAVGSSALAKQPVATTSSFFIRLFARARCLLFRRDIFGCERAWLRQYPLLITAVVVAKSYVAPLSEDIDLK